jgi:hypothetical protein
MLDFIKRIFDILSLFWDNKRRFMISPCCLCVCVSICVCLCTHPNFVSSWGLWDHLAASVSVSLIIFFRFLWRPSPIKGKLTLSYSQNFLRCQITCHKYCFFSGPFVVFSILVHKVLGSLAAGSGSCPLAGFDVTRIEPLGYRATLLVG